MSKNFYTSDHHFWHSRLLTFNIPTRQFKHVEHMNDVMIKRWNSVVSHDDIVHYIGDFCLERNDQIPSILACLNGKEKHLYLGNHDISPDKMEIHQKAGWTSIQETAIIEDNGWRVWLAHIPLQIAEDKRKYVRPLPPTDYDICLGGHVHDKYIVNDCGSINVGVDVHDFYPRTLEELMEIASKAPIEDSSKYYPV